MPEHPSDYACLFAVADEKSKRSSRLTHVDENPFDWNAIGDEGDEAHVRAAVGADQRERLEEPSWSIAPEVRAGERKLGIAGFIGMGA